MSWTIRHDGADYEVVTDDGSRTSRLLVDGIEVDQQSAGYWESSTLAHAATAFEVRWGPRNTTTACTLVAPGDGDEPAMIPLIPPPGSKAAKREAFQRKHPTAYVLQRAAWAGLEVLVGLLGISALLGTLLPRLDLSWVPTPSLLGWLPDVAAPDWLRYLDISHWLRRLGLSLPDVGIPGWAEAVLEHKTYWMPVVVAALIALGEIQRRRRIDAERDGRTTDDS